MNNKVQCPKCGSTHVRVVMYETNKSKTIGHKAPSKTDRSQTSLYHCNTEGCEYNGLMTFEGVHFNALTKYKEALTTTIDFDEWNYKINYFDEKKKYCHMYVYKQGACTYPATAYAKTFKHFLEGNVKGNWVAEWREDSLTGVMKIAFNTVGEVYNN